MPTFSHEQPPCCRCSRGEKSARLACWTSTGVRTGYGSARRTAAWTKCGEDLGRRLGGIGPRGGARRAPAWKRCSEDSRRPRGGGGPRSGGRGARRTAAWRSGGGEEGKWRAVIPCTKGQDVSGGAYIRRRRDQI